MVGSSYPSAEVQSTYSTTPVNWAVSLGDFVSYTGLSDDRLILILGQYKWGSYMFQVKVQLF